VRPEHGRVPLPLLALAEEHLQLVHIVVQRARERGEHGVRADGYKLPVDGPLHVLVATVEQRDAEPERRLEDRRRGGGVGGERADHHGRDAHVVESPLQRAVRLQQRAEDLQAALLHRTEGLRLRAVATIARARALELVDDGPDRLLALREDEHRLVELLTLPRRQPRV
jgi:hypothetical protein